MFQRGAAMLALLVVASPAWAQPDEDTGFIGAPRVPLEIDDCPQAPDVPAKQLESMAAERYDRGEVLHLQGDYQGAVDELVHGYCLVPELAGRLLKDIAQSYERLVQYEKAVAYFERYLLVIASQPQTADEQRAVATRIQVLRQLRSNITVATEPRGAQIIVSNDAGPVATRRDGERLEVTAGNYTLTVEKTGYETIRQPLAVGIGQPYSYSFRLKPRSGTLRVQAVPGDARIIIDDRLAGIGSFAGDLEIGPHWIAFEARGYVDAREKVEIIAGETKQVSKTLDRPPTSGKSQLIVASTLAGAVIGAAAVGGSTDDGFLGTLGGVAGLTIGGAGTYFLYDDIDVGSSSYIITSGMIGVVEGVGVGLLASDDSDAAWIGGLVGASAGAGFAMATADRFRFTAGDAALLNSGASWGLVSGLWFTQVFHASSNVGAAMVLGGTNLGVVGGVLLGRQLDYSRRHVALIDLAGLVGIATGLSVHSGVVGNNEDEMVERDEQQAHFALAGMAIGLGAGALLTRNMDAPKLPRLQPQIAPTTPGTGKGWILSVGGSY
jgi:hypothetical protein